MPELYNALKIWPRSQRSLIAVQALADAFHASHEQRYKTYEIPKSNGKFRLISEPQENLKVIQRRLARLFSYLYENKLKNLEKTQKGFRRCAHGFLPKKNISTNAKLHVDKSWLLNWTLGFLSQFREKEFAKKVPRVGTLIWTAGEDWLFPLNGSILIKLYVLENLTVQNTKDCHNGA